MSYLKEECLKNQCQETNHNHDENILSEGCSRLFSTQDNSAECAFLKDKSLGRTVVRRTIEGSALNSMSSRRAVDSLTACSELSPQSEAWRAASQRLLLIVLLKWRKRGTRVSLSSKWSITESVWGPMLIIEPRKPSILVFGGFKLVRPVVRVSQCLKRWGFAGNDVPVEAPCLTWGNSKIEDWFGTLCTTSILGRSPPLWSVRPGTGMSVVALVNKREGARLWMAISWARFPAGRQRHRINPLPWIVSSGRWDGPSTKIGFPGTGILLEYIAPRCRNISMTYMVRGEALLRQMHNEPGSDGDEEGLCWPQILGSK